MDISIFSVLIFYKIYIYTQNKTVLKLITNFNKITSKILPIVILNCVIKLQSNFIIIYKSISYFSNKIACTFSLNLFFLINSF